MSKLPSHNRNRQEELLQVAVQAAEWLVVLEDASEVAHEEFAQWLIESPLHTQMFLRAAAIDRKGASLHPTVLSRLMERLEEVEPDRNVLPLRQTAERPTFVGKQRASSRRWWPLGLAAGVLLAIAATWLASLSHAGRQSYVTDIGEQRSVVLQDGSLLHINTQSRVDVRYSSEARDVRIVSGEALFSVQHDASRPFRVHADDTVVQAIGTQFNVYRRAREVTVSVIEGVVRISREQAATRPSASGSSPVRGVAVAPRSAPEELVAGQAATVEIDGEIRKREPVDAAQAIAWRERQLVFERATLADIVTEFNRYNRKPQLRVDRGIGDKHIYTAVFDANDPQTLLTFLAQDGALEFVTKGEELIIRPRAVPSAN